MPVIKMKSGKDITFEEFTPKEVNLIKINLNNTGADNGEGIWACISDRDKPDYDKDMRDSDYKRVAILRNDAIAFYPERSWGGVHSVPPQW